MLTMRPAMPTSHDVAVVVARAGESFVVFQDGVYRGVLSSQGVARAIVAGHIEEADIASPDYLPRAESPRC